MDYGRYEGSKGRGLTAPMPAWGAHQGGLPAALWAGVASRAAAHHAAVSVDTIIKASSCRATERPGWALRPCLRAPTAAGWEPCRREAVHRANTAYDNLPGPVDAAPCVKHHRGLTPCVHPHSATGFGALRDLLFPIVFQEGRCTAPQGPAGGGVRVDYGQVHREIPPPVPRLQQDICRASAIPGYIHFAVMRNRGFGRDLAEERLGSKVPIPEARLLA